MAAVTGTNGKTSLVQFSRQLWGSLGLRSASIGTLGIAVEGIEKVNNILSLPHTILITYSQPCIHGPPLGPRYCGHC